MACRPDGKQITSASIDRSVRIWDGGPQTPEWIERQREAILFHYFQRAAADLVDRGFFFDEFREQIHTNPILNGETGDRFLAHAERLWASGIFNDTLNKLSWLVVANRESNSEQLKRALRQAEHMTSRGSEDGMCLNTLGVAQYRNGRFADAAKSLNRSLSLNEKRFGVAFPADLAFLAMAQLRLGKHPEARASFAKLTDAIKAPNWKDDAESKQFFMEAEELFKELKVPTTAGPQ